MSDTPYPDVRFRCSTVIDGFEQTAMMSLKRSVWDQADEQWRAEYLDNCRDRYQVWLHQETGIDLTDEQKATVSVVVADTDDGAVPRLFTVPLYGGPLDGQSTAVDLADPNPWIAIVADGCAHPGGRSVYAPDQAGRWTWTHDIPWEHM